MTLTPEETARRVRRAVIDLGAAFGEQETFAAADLPGIGRLAELAGRAVNAADASGRALFAAWRALPDPAPDPAARAGLALLRLREHRGSGHLIAVAAAGLTPLTAILAGPGPAKAAANGWQPPYPEAGDAARLLAAVDERTDRLAGLPYAGLDAGERAEFVALLLAAYRHSGRCRGQAAPETAAGPPAALPKESK
jgi:hypothetical protein